MFPLYDLNPHHRFPWLTLLLIVANVAVTTSMSGMNDRQTTEVALKNGFVPKRLKEVGSGKPVTITITDEEGKEKLVAHLTSDPRDVYPTLFTTMFLHGGWFHMLSNMWILWIFGNNVEDRLGHLIYIIYYLIGGLAATLSFYAIDPRGELPVIGASGAVATVLGGYAVTYPWAKVRTLFIIGIIFVADIPALVWLGIWFVLQMVPGLLSLNGVLLDNVAYWAHIGGFVAGVILMPVMSLGSSPPGTDWRKEADEMFQFSDPRTKLD